MAIRPNFILPQKKRLFSNHYYPGTKSGFYILDVVFSQNGNTISKEHLLKLESACCAGTV